jgi:serine protease inhibitor
MSNHACRVIPLVLMALAAGCKETTGVLSPGPGGPGPAQLTEQEAAVSQANTGFGLSLLREVLSEESDPNVLVSPLSASMALGMTMNGAGGDTWDAMRSTLGFGTMPEAEVREAYRGLIDYLNGRDPSVEFGLANSAWYEESFPVHEAFLDVAREYFDAEVVGLDFQDPASPGVISAWAEEKTGGRIRDLVTDIDPLEKLFLVNAVYFSAPWSLPFNPDATRDGDFRTLEGDVVQVPLMSLDGNVHYRSDDLVEAVELIYADSAYSMVVMAPGEGAQIEGLADFLTPGGLEGLVDSMTSGRIFLTLPKFSFEYDILLDPALERMGMGIAFQPWVADFTRIADRDDIHITRVEQKAFIDVHELGTEATAATSVGVGITSMPPQVTFDRPFFFLIRDRDSGAILFLGRLGDPSNTGS